MIRVHFHSDAQRYLGCEQMLTTFFTSELMAQNCKIDFSYRYTPEYEEGMDRWLDEAGGVINLMTHPLKFPVTKVFHKRLLRGLIQYASFWGITKGFSRMFHELKPQIIHINNGGYPGSMSCNAAAIAGGMYGAKVIYFANGITPRSRFRTLFDRKFLDWKVRNCTDVFLTGSIENRIRLAQRLTSTSYSPIFRTMPNTLHPRKNERERKEVRSALGLSDDDILLGCIAVFSARKGIEVLVQAYKTVFAKFGMEKRVDLLLVGEHGDSSYMVEMLKVKYPVNVHVSHNTINNHNFLKAMDVFVYHPLEQEDFGNNILMALKLGVPVVASAISGNKEMIIDGQNGYLVEPGNVAGVVLCTESLIKDDRMRVWMGANGKKIYQDKYSNEVVLGAYLDLYREVLGESL